MVWIARSFFFFFGIDSLNGWKDLRQIILGNRENQFGQEKSGDFFTLGSSEKVKKKKGGGVCQRAWSIRPSSKITVGLYAQQAKNATSSKWAAAEAFWAETDVYSCYQMTLLWIWLFLTVNILQMPWHIAFQVSIFSILNGIEQGHSLAIIAQGNLSRDQG